MKKRARPRRRRRPRRARAAFAAEPPPLPKDLPAYGADRPLPVPAIAQSTLPNGLTVWLVKRPGFPKVSAVLAVRAAPRPTPRAWRASPTSSPTRSRKGRRRRPRARSPRSCRRIGGDLGVSAGADAIYPPRERPRDRHPALLDLLAAVAPRPAVPGRRGRAREGERPAGAGGRGGDSRVPRRRRPSRRPSTATTRTTSSRRAARRSAKTTPELLRQEHARRFRPDQALLVVAGDLDEAAAKAAVAKAFGAWKGAGAPLPAAPASPAARGREILLVDRPGSVQSTVVSGRPGPNVSDPDWYDVLVANTIYADAFGSRLVKNIREEKGYTYSPSGDFTTRRAGSLLADAGRRPQRGDRRDAPRGLLRARPDGGDEADRRRARGREALPGRASTSSATRSRAPSPAPSRATGSTVSRPRRSPSSCRR